MAEPEQPSNISLPHLFANYRKTIQTIKDELFRFDGSDRNKKTLEVISNDLRDMISTVERLGGKHELAKYIRSREALLEILNDALIELKSALLLLNEKDVNVRLDSLKKVENCRKILSAAEDVFVDEDNEQAYNEVQPVSPPLTSSSPEEPESSAASTIIQPAQPSPPTTPQAVLNDLDEVALFRRLSSSSRQALNEADGIRLALGQGEIHMEHLIAGLLAKTGGPTEELLGKANIDMANLGEVIQVSFPTAGSYKPSALAALPNLSKHVRDALIFAVIQADIHKSEVVRTRHLLYGALLVDFCHIIETLLARGVRKEDIDLSQPPLESTTPIHPVISGFKSDTPDGQDLLGVKREVEALCSVLAAKDIQPPLSLGLFGDWGIGKSFFMRMMQERIEQLKQATRLAKGETAYCRDIVQLKFNAWHYIDTDLWASLSSEIFQGLAEALASKEDIDSEYKRAHLLANAMKSKDELVKAEQAKNEADAQLRENKQRLQQLEHEEATIEASLTPQAIIQGAWRLALRQPEVRETIQKTKEDLDVKMEEAANRLHYPASDATSAELKTQLLELRGIGGMVKALAIAIRNAEGRQAQLQLVGGIAILLLALGGAFILLSVYRSYLLGAVSSVAAVLVAVTVFLAPFLPRVKQALNYIKSAQEEYAHLIEEARKHKKEELQPKHKELQSKVDDAEQRLVKAQEHLEKVSAAVKHNEQAMEGMRPDRQMLDFIKQRQASTIYTKHLGVIAQAREDFEKLSILLAKEQEDAEKGTPPAQEGPLLPRIDRIILYIDDLDRCPENQVVDVLQAVHLLLAFPLFVVVVGVDSRWLLHSLKRHSRAFLSEASKQDGIPDEEMTHWQTTPLNYLEKIFQIPFALRPMQAAGFERLVDSLSSQQKSTRLGAGPPNEQIVGKEGGDGSMDLVQQVSASIPHRSSPGTMEGLPMPSPLPSGAPEELTPGPVALPQEDIDLNPGFLQIEEWEKQVMKKLYRFIPSPRAAKRFINVYRLLRASVDNQKLRAFIGDENGGQHRSMLLLLAMLIRYPAETTEILRSLLEQKPSGTWWNFIDSFRSRADHDPTLTPVNEMEIENWRQLMEKLAEVKPLIQEDQFCEDFVECAPQVARYSYQSGPVLFAQ